MLREHWAVKPAPAALHATSTELRMLSPLLLWVQSCLSGSTCTILLQHATRGGSAPTITGIPGAGDPKAGAQD